VLRVPVAALTPGNARSLADRLAPAVLSRYSLNMADAASNGILHGTTITLDSPVPPLDGKRVRVLLALADDDATLAAEQQAEVWNRWVAHGPQGPIEDDQDPEFP